MCEHERGLLEAVLEAISLPLPATHGDGEVYERLLAERLGTVRAVLRDALTPADDLLGDDVEWLAGYLRRRTAEVPAAGYKSGVWPGVPVEDLSEADRAKFSGWPRPADYPRIRGGRR